VRWLLLAAFAVVFAAELGLKLLNRRHLRTHGGRVPEELAPLVDGAALARIRAYTLEGGRLDLVRSAFHAALAAAFLFGGLLGLYDRWIGSLTGSFVGGGVLFFVLLAWIEVLLGVPFSLYRNFRIEARHGFNRMTGGLWLADLVKSLLVSTLLLAGTAAAALTLVRWSPERWWLWVWGFLLVLTLFLMYVSPFLIEPLFWKFEPLRAPGLEARVRALCERAGLRVSRVFQVDASRRSRHSNAYFTGIGRVKRIVLFDTLLEQMGEEEILAVLAHEVGHWKLRHILRRIVWTEAVSLAALFAAFHAVSWPGLPGWFGLAGASFPARAVMVGFLGSLLSFPFSPLKSWLSRRHEWAADRFAAALTGHPGDLATALGKLSRENLGNLHPHPLYAAFHYSHPPVVDRIRALRSGSGPGGSPNRPGDHPL